MSEEMPVQELEILAEENVGEALRRMRLCYKKSLEDIEIALRIRSSQIEAIEKGDMDALPGRVYAIGFVRSYAEYMQLDGAKVVQLFKEQYMDGNLKAALSFPIPASETKTPPIWLVALCLLVLSVFLIVLQHFFDSDRRLVEVVEAVPERIKNQISRNILEMPETGGISGKDDNAYKTGVLLNILGDSWVEIKDDKGNIIVSNILSKGDEYFVPNSPGLSMSLGNAANVEIVLNGRALKPLGADGEVRKGIPLNVTYLERLVFVDEE